jgi:hypothetical protein
MDVDITTPIRPPAEEQAHHTRETGPNTPSNENIKQRKKPKTLSFRAPEKLPRKAAGLEETVQSMMTGQLAQVERDLRVKKEVITKLAGTLDGFVESFQGDHLSTQRRTARELVNVLARHLNTAVFAETDGHLYAPIRVESSPEQTQESEESGLGSHNRPKETPANQTWATVAKGPKKGGRARVTPPTTNTKSQHSTAKTTETRTSAPAPQEDLRILIRMPATPTARAIQPYAVRQAVVSEFQLTLKDVPDAKPTATGFAIKLATAELRDKVMGPENKPRLSRALQAEAVELPETWASYIVPGVPGAIVDYLQRTQQIVTPEMVIEEVIAQTGSTPADVRISRHGVDPVKGTATWHVSFRQPTQRFRLFSASELSRVYEKKITIIRCENCQGHHRGRFCTRIARCGRCSGRKDEHGPGVPCEKPPKCANCYGPHRADNPQCPARPQKVHGKILHKTKSQVKAIRKIGSRRFVDLHAMIETAESAEPVEAQEAQEAQEALTGSERTVAGRPTTDARALRGRKRAIKGDTPADSTPPNQTDTEMREAENTKGPSSRRPQRLSSQTAETRMRESLGYYQNLTLDE